MSVIVGGQQPATVDPVVVVLVAVLGVWEELSHVITGDQQASARCNEHHDDIEGARESAYLRQAIFKMSGLRRAGIKGYWGLRQ